MTGGADGVHKVRGSSIGAFQSGARAIGRLGENHECDEKNGCGNIHEELMHQRNYMQLAAGVAMAIVVAIIVPQTPLDAQGKGGKAAPKNLKVLTPENLVAQ